MGLRGAIAAVAALLYANSCVPTVCDPGETQTCFCPGGATSAQICADDGQRWDHCACAEAGDDDDDDDLGPFGDPAELRLGDEVVCVEPQEAGPLLPFVDLTDEAGISFAPATPEMEAGQLPEGLASLDIEHGGGQVSADLDGDGHLDLIFTDAGAAPRYFLGDGDFGFEERTAEEAGLPATDVWLHGVSAVDVDGDGDLDLLLLARGPNHFLRNRGDGIFDDATVETGLGGEPFRSSSGTWADFDRDGDLDVHVANHGEGTYGPGDSYDAHPDQLFVQGADGTFEERIDELYPYERDGYGFASVWFDADADGWTDLYVVNDMSSKGLHVPNVLMRNSGTGDEDGWDWEEGSALGLDRSMFAMGVGVGDMDNDLDLDVHVTDAGPTFLARNDLIGDVHVFTDVSLTVIDLMFTEQADISFATDWFDHDNDGWQELHTTFSYMPTKGPGYGPAGATNDPEQPDGLWWWDHELGNYVDIAPEVGLADVGLNHSAVVSDLNRDGFNDVVVFGIYSGPRLYASACNDRSWLRVHLEMPGTKNVDAIGAEVELWSEGVGQQLRLVRAGLSGTYSGGPPEVHFGTGELESVDLVVRWPDGVRTVNRAVPTRRDVWLTR